MKETFYVSKIIIFLILGVASLSRAYTMLPAGLSNVSHENIPAPLIFHALNGSPLAFTIAWGVSGLLLLFSAFWGHKITVFSPKSATVRLRLDDLAVLLNIFLIALWGVSYYISFFTGIATNHHNNDNISARNYLPWAIITFIVWRIWFSERAPKEVITGENLIA